jgi:hypothetical protein
MKNIIYTYKFVIIMLNNARGPLDIKSYWSAAAWPNNVKEKLDTKILMPEKEIDWEKQANQMNKQKKVVNLRSCKIGSYACCVLLFLSAPL